MSTEGGKVLLLTIRLHDGRYHGAPEWPPSPARLFQALVAGAGLSGPLRDPDLEALRWLEELANPPLIVVPRAWLGQRVMFYMPNNDLDHVDGDPRRVASIRTAEKYFHPRLFEQHTPFLYAWFLEGREEKPLHLQTIELLAARLYQFGRGVDMAWAEAAVIPRQRFDEVVAHHQGTVYRPASAGTGHTLLCPTPGSLHSIQTRFRAYRERFRPGDARIQGTILMLPPKPKFTPVAYDSPPVRYLFDLRAHPDLEVARWPLVRAHQLVVAARDAAADRLRGALRDRHREIERHLIGRKADGADAAPAASRVRIVPLPSIGHHHADHLIRRVLVEVPAECTLRAEDVRWAFSGLEVADPVVPAEVVLSPAADDRMLARYGIGDAVGHRVWRTITPAALPEAVGRRRIDPARMREQAKGGEERAMEQARAARAVAAALRHAGVRARALEIRVQREPFSAQGERVEPFAAGTRFPKERLWHVEIAFAEPVAGPLLLGDGRFLGLGVMAPDETPPAVHCFEVVSGLTDSTDAAVIARALRRAVMARVQAQLGAGTLLPAYFSGHERDGSPARSGHAHLFFAFDGAASRLLVIAPHVAERRAAHTRERDYLRDLEAALLGFAELRAGSAGRLVLRNVRIEPEQDPLFAASRRWESLTPYQVMRHTKKAGADTALAADLRSECRRLDLPEPDITVLDTHGVSGAGLMGRVRLDFRVAVSGPLLLGRSRHLGGGLFTARAI